MSKQNNKKIFKHCPPESCKIGTIAPMAQRINSLDLHQITQICIEEIPKLVGARFASLYLMDEQSDILHLVKHNHPFLINNIVSLNQSHISLMVKAAKSRQLVVVKNLNSQNEPTFIKKTDREFSANYKSSSCVIAPLICQNKVVGVLNIADKIDGREFNETEVNILELFRQLIGASIGNVKLFEKAQQQAKSDGLTGLANHRTFYETLEKELRRIQRYGGMLSVIMLDMDNLKPINDNHGLRAGDAAIKKVSRIITNCIRKIDTAARYGGDEFAVILPNTPLDDAVRAAERIVEQVNNSIVICEHKGISLSVSAGVGQYDGSSCAESITHCSDEALYAAKQAGKGTVKVYNHLKASVRA